MAGDLSGGMKQKLGLACVLVHQPQILILDEPTNGVDPVSRQEFWGILERMKRQNMTILVSTAYMDEGEKCDRLILMHRSRILDDATPQEMRERFSDLEQAIIHRIERVDEGLVRFLRRTIMLFIYILGVLVLLDYLNISITPIIAGLGIGGLAVALALQPLLGSIMNLIYTGGIGIILIIESIRYDCACGFQTRRLWNFGEITSC